MVVLGEAILARMSRDASVLIADLHDARRRLLELVENLDDDQLRVPRLAVVNPILWEIGHVAWFQERWCLREGTGDPSMLAGADELYDSAAVVHDTRWELRLPTRAETLAYMARVLEAAVTRIEGRTDPAEFRGVAYRARLAALHEDMHGEALVYTRRTLGYPPPRTSRAPLTDAGAHPGDVEIQGGEFALGTAPSDEFTFDNEMDSHTLRVGPFRIARAAVTQAEYARFVDERGYARRELWSDAGWRWRTAEEADHPLHWRRERTGWTSKQFDHYVELRPHAAMLHVNWFEAEAWCAWAGRRLPTELEWEVAALGELDERGALARRKRVFPWGDSPPTPELAHLDLRGDEPCDVGAFASGDSAFGCRQMIGNTWEWCASDFAPYPGFVAGPYAEYSAPWFTGHKVLRGGCYATRSRLIRGTYRNFYTPDRRDVLAGFRTCARWP